MLKKITSNKILVPFIFFIFLHIALLNINYAEWGDSYRILRASEYLREGSYPEDEKRAPLYSIFLALRPENVDQVTWGRIEMLVLSVVTLFVFYKLLKEFNLSERAEKLALWLLILNPVVLYWSIRLMADVPFTLIVLLAFFVYKKWESDNKVWRLLLLGGLLGLGVLTRFEGYILGFSLGLGLIYKKIAGRKSEIGKTEEFRGKDLIKSLFYVFFGFIVISLPWYLARNPISSAYFEEPSRRVYDLNTLYIYIVSSMFLFGFSSACYFFIKDFKKLKGFSQNNVFIITFLVIELILALIWPAAIPRLFVPAIPIMIILLAKFIDDEFSKSKEEDKKECLKDAVILLSLLVFYIVSQYFLKLQFLVLIKSHLAVVLVVQLVIIFSILKKKFSLFKISLIISMLFWSLSTIYIHKDIFKVVVNANKYAVSNLEGVIAYNDVSSISDWYLNQKCDEDRVNGVYLNMDSREGRTYEELAKKNVDYIIITNEHNTDMEFNVSGIKYLEEIKEFRYTIRGEEFFTKIIEFKR